MAIAPPPDRALGTIPPPPVTDVASSPVPVQDGPRIWYVLPEYVDWFSGESGILPAIRKGTGQIVKHGKHRTVIAIPAESPRCYVKHYRIPDLRAAINRWLLGARARREWDVSREVLQRGVPTLRPLAWGASGWSRGDSFLVTLAEPNVRQLDQILMADARRWGVWFEPLSSPETRAGILRTTADLIALAHRQGIYHGDLHAGNILLRNERGEWKAFLIDLLGCRIRTAPLNWSSSQKDLLCLGIAIMKYTSADERRFFLDCYLCNRPELGLDAADVFEGFESELWKVARHAWWKRDEQCVGVNRRFYFLWGTKAHAYVAGDIPRDVARTYLEQPLTPNGFTRVLKSSPSSLVVAVDLTIEGEKRTFLWKEFRPKTWMDRLRAVLYRTPAMRSWRGAHVLQLRGLPTPRAYMLVETCSGALPDASYLLTEYIAGSETLATYVARALQKNGRELHWRKDLAERLGTILQYMHRCSISHRDLKFANWLVVAESGGDIRDLYIIDLAGLQVWRRLPHRRIVQNLARLWISAHSLGAATCTDALRFLRAYLPPGEFRREWKRWWRRIQAFAESKARVNRSNGRVLA